MFLQLILPILIHYVMNQILIIDFEITLQGFQDNQNWLFFTETKNVTNIHGPLLPETGIKPNFEQIVLLDAKLDKKIMHQNQLHRRMEISKVIQIDIFAILEEQMQLFWRNPCTVTNNHK